MEPFPDLSDKDRQHWLMVGVQGCFLRDDGDCSAQRVGRGGQNPGGVGEGQFPSVEAKS